MSEPEPFNYFNYFTEIEEHFQRARGTGLFLLSPLDWALVEAWKDSGIPLEAVLRGIDKAFEELEQRLTSLEEKMIAQARVRQSEADLVEMRKQLESQLKAYRSKMSAPELMLVERKFLDQRLIEANGLPRFSLFYLG